MPRSFPLQAVLQLRRRREEQEERTLGEISQALGRAEAALAHVQRTMQQLGEQRARDLQGRLLAADLQDAAAREGQLRQNAEQWMGTIHALQTQRSEQQRRYLAARTGRETLTELHEKHEKSWRLEQASREQKRVDEIVAARWKRNC